MPDGVSPRAAGETMSPQRVEGQRDRLSRGRFDPAVWIASMGDGFRVLEFAVQYIVIPWAAGFLLGRAVVLDALYPFGKAFVVALAAVGQRGRALAAAFGVLFAALSSPPNSPMDSPASALVFVWLFAAVAGRLFRLSPWVSAAGAMLGAATLGVVAAAFAGDNVVLAGLVGGVDMLAAAVLLPVTQQLFRLPRRGAGARWTGPVLSSVLIFASLLLLGTIDLAWAGFSVHGVVWRAFVVLGALAAGPSGGAVAGTLLGLLTVLADPAALWEAVVIAVTGLGAGLGAALFQRQAGTTETTMYARIGGVLGLVVVQLLLSFMAPEGKDVLAALVHSALAAAVAVLLPETLLQWLGRRLTDLDKGAVPSRNGRPSGGTPGRGPLLRLANAFDRAAATLAAPESAAYGAPINGGAGPDQGAGVVSGSAAPEADRPRFADPSSPGADGFSASPEALDQAEPLAPGDSPEVAFLPEDTGRRIVESRDGFEQFVGDVRARVCRGCSHEIVCWETYGWQTYRDLLAFVTDVFPDEEEGDPAGPPRVEPDRLPQELRQRCIQLQHFTMGVEKLLALVYDRARHERQMHRWQAPIQRQLNGLAEIIAMTADEISRLERRQAELADAPPIGPTRPRFQLQTDQIYVPGDEAVVSGDFFQQVVLPDHRVAFIVCDGMGSGARAAAESRAVAAMLARFLEVGFDLRFSVQTMNSVMLLRGGDESFVTVDVSIVDLTDGEVHVAKTGAAPTYIHRGGDVEMVRADSLPAGILPSVDVYESRYRLNMGDVLVMMTDGALELTGARGDKGELARRHLLRMERPRPKLVVDSLFSRARPTRDRPLPDDVTIVAAQLLPAVLRSP